MGGTRAVLLVQLAPSQPRDDARLAYFLELVPDRMRVAVEFRHASWHCEDVFALLASRPRLIGYEPCGRQDACRGRWAPVRVTR